MRSAGHIYRAQDFILEAEEGLRGFEQSSQGKPRSLTLGLVTPRLTCSLSISGFLSGCPLFGGKGGIGRPVKRLVWSSLRDDGDLCWGGKEG